MKKYDDNNPWHANANLMFGFQCHTCDNDLDFESFEIKEINERFLEICVTISDKAIKDGWKMQSEFQFICKSCASK